MLGALSYSRLFVTKRGYTTLSTTLVHLRRCRNLSNSLLEANMSTQARGIRRGATPPSDSTPTDSNESTTQQSNNQKKRKQHWFQRKQEKKKDRVKGQAQYTGNRRGLDDEWESQTPHEGSFACLALQEQFQVTVPTFDEICCNQNSQTQSGYVVGIHRNHVCRLSNECPATNTLHAQVELALYKCQYLSQTNFGFPHKYSWSNSARTDKGVHACAQVVSCKLEIPDDNLEAARQAINAHLPEDIRVLDIVKVSRAFCAKTQRDRARYTYMIPSFLLYNREELQKLFTSVLGPNIRDGRSPRDPLSVEEMQQLASTLYKFRATPRHLTTVARGTRAIRRNTVRFTILQVKRVPTMPMLVDLLYRFKHKHQ